MNEGQWLAWHVYAEATGQHPVRIQFLTMMSEGSYQVRLESGLCIIVTKKFMDRLMEIPSDQWAVTSSKDLPVNAISSVDGGHTVPVPNMFQDMARAASNALGALAFEQSKYGERWRSPDEPRPRSA